MRNTGWSIDTLGPCYSSHTAEFHVSRSLGLVSVFAYIFMKASNFGPELQEGARY